MLAPSTAKFAPLGAKEFEALDLPWLFKDTGRLRKSMKGPIGKWLFQKLEAKGITASPIGTTASTWCRRTGRC